jgi:hypothetical protein
MKKVIIYVGCAIVLIVGIGMVVLYNMGDRIFDEVIRSQLESIDLTEEPTGDSGNTAQVDGNAAVSQQSAGANEQGNNSAGQTPDGSKTAGDSQKSDPNATGGKAGSSEGSSGNTGKTTGKTDTTASGKTTGATKQTGEKPAGSGTDNKTILPDTEKITVDKINEVKDKVSAADKMEAAALVLKRLSTDEINMLTKMLAGGLTPEEKAQAEKLAYSKFTKDEIEKIRNMYLKYME